VKISDGAQFQACVLGNAVEASEIDDLPPNFLFNHMMPFLHFLECTSSISLP
jgi:hypothetical protein